MAAANKTDTVKSDGKFEASVQWLEENARKTIRDSAREMPCGINAFPPQVGSGYEAFWLRDYGYMLETCADAFSKDELLAACRLFVDGIDSDGSGVDCIRFDGKLVYKPGYGTMGSKPVADGGQFTVNVAWNTWKQTEDKELLAEIIPSLIKTMRAVPVNPESGLVHISSAPGEDRCPYGFTDTVGKSGDVLFCSLLYFQASERLAEMLDALGRKDESKDWKITSSKVKESVNQVLRDEETGLYLAATENCRQPDIWGSAFAVWLKVAAPEQAGKVASYFAEHYDEICCKGQIRHLPGGIYWEKARERDQYQNGAYWATPTGWFVHTLAIASPQLAKQTVVDLVDDFKQCGICEWVFEDTAKLPGYVASITLPLQGIRELSA